jgi:hypothetical protein
MENTNPIKSLWDVSNDIDFVAYRLSSIRDVAEIVAERVCTDPESGAIWAIGEMLEVMEKKLEEISFEIMNLHRDSLEAKPKAKKGTKK